uniref:Myb/SANT-like DNA-binding domain-containing protein n=1 Tax=Anopheles farauti TaxID=69004 RepID=A0A182R0R9_9DIPT
MAKRTLWTYEETVEMLNIMHEQESLKAMNGRPYRKHKAFQIVQDEMAMRGYSTKDTKQIEYRWKNLKKRYMDIQKNPGAEAADLFQYYNEIDLIMKGKPPATETKLYALSITKVSPKQNTATASGSFQEHYPAIEKVDVVHEFDDDLTNEDSDDGEPDREQTPDVPHSSKVPLVTKRTKRGKKGGAFQRSGGANVSSAADITFTERDVFQNQKALIDYQFGLYSKAQEESDKKFLEMSRQIFEQCNERFQTFFEKL